jgi:hypothetical protein
MRDLIVLLITGFFAFVGCCISVVAAYRSVRSVSRTTTVPLINRGASPKVTPNSVPTNVVFETELFEFETDPEEREIYTRKVAHKRAIEISRIEMVTG